MRWNCILAAFFLVVWISMMSYILFPDEGPISQVNAFVASIASFPLFAFYAARYDEETVIPFNYLPYAYSHAKYSVEFDGVVLFVGRLFVLGFMALLMWAAILLGFLNAEGAANDIAVYAYYSLVLGVALIAMSSCGRREIPLGGKRVERSSLDLGLSSAYHFLKTRQTAYKAMLRSYFASRQTTYKAMLRSYFASRQTTESVPIEKDMISEILAIRHELLSSMEELRSRLDAMQQILDQQLEEIRKRLARIEEKLDHNTD